MLKETKSRAHIGTGVLSSTTEIKIKTGPLNELIDQKERKIKNNWVYKNEKFKIIR